MTDSPHERATTRSPHPLTRSLVERLRGRPACRILDFATGSGRNADALRRAGHDVVAIRDGVAAGSDALPASLGAFSAALSTHGLLHGTRAAIATQLAAIAARLEPDGALYATFGSVRDARYGCGGRLAPSTFVPLDGDEAGVAHTYFTRAELAALLHPHFTIEQIEEREVDAIAGGWAHPTQRLTGAVHWFVVARASMRSSSGLDAFA